MLKSQRAAEAHVEAEPKRVDRPVGVEEGGVTSSDDCECKPGGDDLAAYC